MLRRLARKRGGVGPLHACGSRVKQKREGRTSDAPLSWETTATVLHAVAVMSTQHNPDGGTSSTKYPRRSQKVPKAATFSRWILHWPTNDIGKRCHWTRGQHGGGSKRYPSLPSVRNMQPSACQKGIRKSCCWSGQYVPVTRQNFPQ